MAKRIYWAGYCDGQICSTLEHYGDLNYVLAIYLRKKDAKKNYEDVRKVEVREIKKIKK